MTYDDFLKKKQHTSIDYGINPVMIPDCMFDFQQKIAEETIIKGRYADFIDTGLGKTLIELVVANNYMMSLNCRVLIITPLAVAFQFIKEAEKFGFGDIEYSKDGKFKSKIVVCNYERLDKFSPSDFDCVILDESSILKNFDGAMKGQITAFLKKIKYRFLFTATPSPNDFVELGTSSEALGYLGYMDMLSRYFKNAKNNVAKISRVDKARAGVEFYLKPYAEADFWKWVRSWSIAVRKPSDLGFSDERYILPELREVETVVKNSKPLVKNGMYSLFNSPAVGFAEIKQEVRATIKERCEMAVERASKWDTSVYWTNLNDEADMIRQIDGSAIEIKGKMNIDEKEEILLAFANGQIKKLITKSTITAFGLNWQHCNHTVYFPTYSYEQYYQSIRRFWRFGQSNPVTVDIIRSDGQEKIMEALFAKKDKAVEMFENLVKQTSSAYEREINSFTKEVELPKFLHYVS
jgi:DNA or RNA helicases of superfamily II